MSGQAAPKKAAELPKASSQTETKQAALAAKPAGVGAAAEAKVSAGDSKQAAEVKQLVKPTKFAPALGGKRDSLVLAETGDRRLLTTGGIFKLHNPRKLLGKKTTTRHVSLPPEMRYECSLSLFQLLRRVLNARCVYRAAISLSPRSRTAKQVPALRRRRAACRSLMLTRDFAQIRRTRIRRQPWTFRRAHCLVYHVACFPASISPQSAWQIVSSGCEAHCLDLSRRQDVCMGLYHVTAHDATKLGAKTDNCVTLLLSQGMYM